MSQLGQNFSGADGLTRAPLQWQTRLIQDLLIWSSLRWSRYSLGALALFLANLLLLEFYPRNHGGYSNVKQFRPLLRSASGHDTKTCFRRHWRCPARDAISPAAEPSGAGPSDAGKVPGAVGLCPIDGRCSQRRRDV